MAENRQPEVINDPRAVQERSLGLRALGKSIGLVPTMGALHAGHVALCERARAQNDVVVVSIFVNPAQFGTGEDYKKYPRTFDKDVEKCAGAGVDVVFAPTASAMYPEEQSSFVDVLKLTEHLCGISRPGHFRGVATVVAKLFNIVLPHRAYFGEKDYQQLLVIKRMTRDLFFPVEIVPVPTVREKDGLAMSSRNAYLSPEERTDALVLKEALEHFRSRVAEGERSAMRLAGEMAEIIEAVPSTEIDYIAMVDAETLEDVGEIKGKILAALAVKVGGARLIDNTVLEV
ncbi:MAG TPA: pantoate--beta-alanine ligase [Planctomycetes bacterium]|nr:pantoate--beta-alanine ligase [Planctomycetota bacterium]